MNDKTMSKWNGENETLLLLVNNGSVVSGTITNQRTMFISDSGLAKTFSHHIQRGDSSLAYVEKNTAKHMSGK